MERLLEQMVERDEAARQEAKEEKAKLIAQIEKQRDEMDLLRNKLTATPPQGAISDDQLTALQARLMALHDAQLLSDEELFVLEDFCADFVELQSTVAMMATIDYSLAAATTKAPQARLSFREDGE